MVVINLAVNNQLVPYPEHGSLAYGGYAYLDGTRDTLHLPWAFVKAARVIFTFDRPNPSFAISNSNAAFGDFDAVWDNGYNAQLVMPKGVYDLVAMFLGVTSDRIVIKENLPLDSTANVSILSTDATNSIHFNGVDAGSQPLSSYSSSANDLSVLFPDSSLFVADEITGTPDTLLCSDCTNRITLACGETADDGMNNVYNVQFDPLQGLQRNVNLTNNPVNYYTQNIHAVFPPYSGLTKEMDRVNWSMVTIQDLVTFGFGIGSKITEGFEGDWSGKLYLTENKGDRSSFATSFSAEYSPSLSTPGFYELFDAPPAQVYEDSVGYFFGSVPPSSTYLVTNGGHITFGNPPFFPAMIGYNNISSKSNILEYTSFSGQLNETFTLMADSSDYTIYNNQNAVVSSGKESDFPEQGIDVAAGSYRYQLTNKNYFVRGVRGAATLTCRFDLRNSNPDPPTFTSMSLHNEKGIPVDSMSQGEAGTLTFSAMGSYVSVNDSGYGTLHFVPLMSDSTRLSYKTHNLTNWVSLPVVKVSEDPSFGTLYSANVTRTSAIDSSAVDLKIDVEDQFGNTTEWVMEPAYSIGNYGIATGIQEAQTANDIPKVFALYQNYPNPFNPSTTIKYDLPKETHVSLIVYNILGQDVADIVDATQQPGHYTVSWNGNTRTALAASGVYLVRLEAGDFVKTLKMLLLK